ncbi:MAG: hypothetical protein AAGG07_00190 [Planctomycetota bacterium]
MTQPDLFLILAAAPAAAGDAAAELLAAAMGLARSVGHHAAALVAGLPPELAAASAALTLVGLVLWAFGEKVVKFSASAIGMLMGGAGGLLAAAALHPDPFGPVPSPLVGLAVGSLIGLVAALVTLRFVVGATATIAFAAAGLLGVTAYRQITAPPPDERVVQIDDGSPSGIAQDGAESERPPLIEGVPIVEDLDDETLRDLAAEQDADEQTRAAAQAERLRRFVNALGDEAQDLWDSVPQPDRAASLAGAAIGAAIGLLLGSTMPRRSAAAITALAGAALWLANGRLLLLSTGTELSWIASPGAAAALLVWLGAAAVGLGIQIRRMKKPSD